MASDFESSPYTTLLGRLSGHSQAISALAWSPDGKWLASCSRDGTVNLWSSFKSSRRPRLRCDSATAAARPLTSIAWSHDGAYLASGSESGLLEIWQAGAFDRVTHGDPGSKAAVRCVAWAPQQQPGERRLAYGGDERVVHFRDFADWDDPDVERGVGHEGSILTTAWAPDGTIVVTGTEAGTIGVWVPSDYDNQLRNVLAWRGIRAHDGPVVTLSWSSDTGVLASGAMDGGLHLWNVKAHLPIDQLSFGEEVLHVAFALSGRILVVQTRDHLRFVRSRPLREICAYEFPATLSPVRSSLAVDHTTLLATTDPDDASSIVVWSVDFTSLLKESELTRRTFAAVGVSLLGECGAGRTNLALTLTGQPFSADHQAHGFTVHRMPLSTSAIAPAAGEEHHELVFWDLPSRIDHALVQRVHAGDGAVALIIVSVAPGTLCTSNENLERWRQTLKRCNDAYGRRVAEPCVVITKCDQLLRPPTKEDADFIAKALLVERAFLVSAKTGMGIEALRHRIIESVAWGTAPAFPSTEVLEHLVTFVRELRRERRYLTSLPELYDTFLRRHPFLRNYIRDEGEFRNGAKLLDILGELQLFEGSDELLLEPMYFRTYASMMIAAAERDDAGMRRLPLVQAQLGRGRQIAMEETERIRDEKQERRLLALTIDELTRDNVAQIVSTDGVSHLVFPPDLLRTDEAEPRPERAASCRFTGGVDDVFTSLVVRLLGLENHYTKSRLWRDRASFAPAAGGLCEIILAPTEGSDEAELSVYFGDSTSDLERKNFLELVRKHVRSNARSVIEDFADTVPHAASVRDIRVLVSWPTEGVSATAAESVRHILERLETVGITSFNVTDTRLGVSRAERAAQTHDSRVALFFLGGTLPRSQEIEYRRLAAEGSRIIPVVLPSAPSDFNVPAVFKNWGCLDLRGKFLDESIDRLARGIVDAWRLGPAEREDGAKYVFLSYSREDSRIVSRLYRDIESAGHIVWWDQGNELSPGTVWERAINEAIRQSYAFVLCLSDSIGGGRRSFVYPELRQAIRIQRNLRAGQAFIIPVRLCECEIPDEPIDDLRSLLSLQYFDYFDENTSIAALIGVLDSARRSARGSTGQRSAIG